MTKEEAKVLRYAGSGLAIMAMYCNKSKGNCYDCPVRKFCHIMTRSNESDDNLPSFETFKSPAGYDLNKLQDYMKELAELEEGK